MKAGSFIGVDTGGTFTDIVVISSDGEIFLDKAFSTPASPEVGIFQCLSNVAEQIGKSQNQVVANTERFVHGTTVGTNALIQRRGSRVGLLMTKGFEDTTLITRGPMGISFGISPNEALDYHRNSRPDSIVPKRLIRGISERVSVSGEVVLDLDRAQVVKVVSDLLTEAPESLAVCFNWSFRNSKHEELVREIIGEIAPSLPVSISSEVSPLIGEFERAMTTIVNAFIGPVIEKYVSKMADELKEAGLRPRLEILKSSGGVTIPERVEREAVSLINSGPIGGLVAAQFLGGLLGMENIITSDVGGTSFDVGLIRHGNFEYESLPAVDKGIPVQIPSAKVVAVGAGGGSIAYTDGRRLLVGPESAGSDPGPACYGKGDRATVTDALVILGILDPNNFFGGKKSLDVGRARQIVERDIAMPLGIGVKEAAAGIFEIVTARMSDLVRKVTVESGFDPREFTLFAYGGGGPAHAGVYAESLGVKELVVPFASSVFSAFGCAISDAVMSFARSQPMLLTPEDSLDRPIATVFEDLMNKASLEIEQAGYNEADCLFFRKVDTRYQGQLNELTIALLPGEIGQAVDGLRMEFEREYESRFGEGTTSPIAPLEIITFRLEVIRRTAKPKLVEYEMVSSSSLLAKTGQRSIFLNRYGDFDATVYDGSVLFPGHSVEGPAIIERTDTTVFVPPTSKAEIDRYRNIRISSPGRK